MLLEPAVRDRVTKARSNLLMDEPFFGLLALRLQLKEDPSCADMWTDATSLGYNPAYVSGLTDLELRGLVAHVVMHIAAGHPWRQGARESKRWNGAADRAINHVLKEAGFRLPEGSLWDPKHAGKPAELIYAALEDEEAQPPTPPSASSSEGEDEATGDAPSSPGEGDADSDDPQAGDSGGAESDTAEGEGNGGSSEDGKSSKPEAAKPAPGEVRPALQGTTEADWKMAIQAAVRMQGNLPCELQRLVDIELAPRVDWKEALRQFVQSSVYSPDYCWSRPNRRWLHQGLYMPGLHGQNIGCLVIARDTSGSIGDDYLSVFNAEILDILQTHKPDVAYVLDCDAQIAQVITIEPHDVPESLPAKGGGGTRFQPVFEWIAEQGLNPACVVYLTDLEGSFPAEEPEYPVIWAVPEGHAMPARPPFGELLSITLN